MVVTVSCLHSRGHLSAARHHGCDQRAARRGSKRRLSEASRTFDRPTHDGSVFSDTEGRRKRSKLFNRPWEDCQSQGFSMTKIWEAFLSIAALHLQTPEAREWDDLPTDIQENVLLRLDFKDLLRFKASSKACKKYVESDEFSQSRRAVSEGEFTAINYYIKNIEWRCIGFDLHSKSWRPLPTFLCLPPPDAELFKEYSMTGHGGLLCAEVSKLPNKGHLVVFNPLTSQKVGLPPLLHPRNPVLVHISVNSATNSFKVIVAGSSAASDEHLSRKMEIFDSATSEWKEACDLPGPVFGLNEHQAGVYLDGTLFFISFLEGDCRKGVVAFHVGTGKWLKNMTCPIPFSACSNTLQLVESDGKVYLFSEQEQGRSVEHCIDVLDTFPNPETGVVECQWRKVVRVRKSGGRGLLVYPEHTCVGFGAGKLCIFNSLQRDGVVYDMRDGKQCEVLEAPPADQQGEKFFTLNPASFTFRPSFDTIQISQDHDHNRRTEQAELREYPAPVEHVHSTQTSSTKRPHRPHFTRTRLGCHFTRARPGVQFCRSKA